MKTALLRAFVAAIFTSTLTAFWGAEEVAKLAPPDIGVELAPGQSLGIASVPNLRDIGGYSNDSGALVRRGLLYRSNQLNPISPSDMEKIARLGLKNDFDLRTAEEVKSRPDQVPPGVKYHLLNVLADAKESAAARLVALLQEPKKANRALGSGKVEAMFTQGYREFIFLPSAKKSFRELFVSVGRRDQLPALFHCTTGKDRTGWGAAALLTLIGVPRETVMADFLRSNNYILPAYQREIDAFVAAGGDQSIPIAIFGVKAEYLLASFDEMQKRYGTINNYFAEALGIDAEGQQALRDLYLERPKEQRP